jgi:hypothetical protein
MRRAVTLLVCVLLLGTGPAQSQWRENGKVVPDTAWRKSIGEFGAMLLLTDKPEEFFEAWRRPASPDYLPVIDGVISTHRGGNIASVIVFRGCKPDAKGNCDTEVDYSLLRPDKSLYGEEKRAELWKGKAAPDPASLQPGVGVFGMRVEPDDPLGTYQFKAIIRDRNADVQLVLTQEFQIKPRSDELSVTTFASGESDSTTPDAVNQRLSYFYLRPSEEEFEALQLQLAANLEQFTTGKGGIAMLVSVFLGKVHHKYGWPLLDLGALDDMARSIAGQDESELSRYIWDDTQVDPGKLDTWWVSFFATGDTKYLDNLVAQVGDLEAQGGATTIMIMGAANWSFASNCRQHAAVMEYAKSLLEREPQLSNHDAIRRLISHEEKTDG